MFPAASSTTPLGPHSRNCVARMPAMRRSPPPAIVEMRPNAFEMPVVTVEVLLPDTGSGVVALIVAVSVTLDSVGGASKPMPTVAVAPTPIVPSAQLTEEPDGVHVPCDGVTDWMVIFGVSAALSVTAVATDPPELTVNVCVAGDPA